MRDTLEERSVKQAVAELQRLAVSAALIGMSVSLGIAILYAAMPRMVTGNTGMRSTVEAICVVLWPSAILMLGAQTYHGGIALFLLSACLNAGYFVLATMLLVTIIRKFNFAASAPKPSAVTRQLSAGPLPEGLRRSRPIA